MAVFLVNQCVFSKLPNPNYYPQPAQSQGAFDVAGVANPTSNICGLKFETLFELIHHIEENHISELEPQTTLGNGSNITQIMVPTSSILRMFNRLPSAVPVPASGPVFAPVPVPAPGPVFAPVSVPASGPVFAPVPVPASGPVFAPVSVPTSGPVFAPVPSPVTGSVPTPVSTPVPALVPTPVTTPVPALVPAPVTTPVPVAVPVPLPVPVPVTVPVPGPTPAAANPYKCPNCNKTYKTQHGLRTHQSARHEDNSQSSTPTPSLAPPNPFKCPNCNKTYKTQHGLRTHQNACHEDNSQAAVTESKVTVVSSESGDTPSGSISR